tara:strand:+ start:8168 stop:8551 length:384 start_codon:yes stop_codon:yes gene_type:complete
MSETVELLFNSLTKTNEKDYWEVMGDAHTIFKPSAFTDLGLPEAFVMKYSRTIKSDTSSPKSTIYGDNGEVIHSVEGVLSSSIADALVGVFNLKDAQSESASKMGRGSSLRVLSQAIWDYTHAMQKV